MAIPRHIAVFRDGNGRWAKARGLDRTQGHRAGTDSARRIVRLCGELGVEHLTLYTFSSENWKRPPLEVRALMSLLIEMVHREVDDLNRNNVRLNAVGDLSQLPEKTREALEEGMAKTASNTGLQLHLAISYGSRAEIVEAAKRLARAAMTGRIGPEEINEELVSKHLFTAGIPDPDLMIRTGGDRRISNFLMWQLAYAELWFSDVLWPDFGEEHLKEACDSFGSRERRFGMTSEQLT